MAAQKKALIVMIFAEVYHSQEVVKVKSEIKRDNRNSMFDFKNMFQAK